MASGADLDKFVISIGSCHHSVVETRETIKETLLSRFTTEAKDGNFPVHFDGKQLNRDFGGRRETMSREVLVLTFPYLEKNILVGAVPMETETSYAVATLLNAVTLALDRICTVRSEKAFQETLLTVQEL